MSRPGFDEYVAARSHVLLRFAHLLCGDRHLAEDLVQEVLIKAHRRWAEIEAGNPDAYLKQALVRTHISWRRRRSSSEIAVPQFHDAVSVEAFDDEHASRQEVWQLLSVLPPAQRAVLVLRYFEDLDDRRIAELVGSSASTVRVNAHRGLARLKETLAEHADEAPTGSELAEKIRRGIARATSRRRAATGGAIAAIVAALVLLVPLLRPDSNEPPVVPTPSTTVAPIPTTDLELVPLTLTAPTFPYTFGFVPPGVGPAYVGLSGGEVNLTYGAPVFADWVPLRVEIRTTPLEGNIREQGVRSPTTVNGEPATLFTGPATQDGPAYTALEWQRDGSWFLAGTDQTVSAADLRRFAESMTPGTTVSAVAGLIDEIPSIGALPGAYIDGWSYGGVCIRGDHPRAAMCMSLSEKDEAWPPKEEFLLDGDPAYLYEPYERNLWLIVQRSDGRFVTIAPASPPSLTKAELIAYYRGITFPPCPLGLCG